MNALTVAIFISGVVAISAYSDGAPDKTWWVPERLRGSAKNKTLFPNWQRLPWSFSNRNAFFSLHKRASLRRTLQVPEPCFGLRTGEQKFRIKI
jgi:hypothetical protein